MALVKIDIISDVVCPWCYLGKARLEQALVAMPDVEAEISWRPYMLDPSIPPLGVDRKTYMEAKFGSGPRLGEIHQQLVDLGKEVGITYNFDDIKIAPNTLDAHRMIRWAAQAGAGIQNKLVDRLFQLYFTEGKDIGDHQVLLDVGKEVGMDVSVLEALMPTHAEEGGVIEEIATAKKLGVTGVPCFVINQKYAVSGAQTPGILYEAIKNAIAPPAA